MKNVALSCLVLLLLLLTSTAETAPSAVPPVTGAADTVVAVVAGDLPPTYFNDPLTGKPVGFAIDSMNELCRRAGLKISYVYGKPWEEMQQMLLSGQVDMIPSMIVNDSRKQIMLFTDPIETMPINYIVRKSDGDEHTVPTAGTKIGMMKGSTAASLLRERSDLNLSSYDSMHHLLMELLAGRIDMVLTATPNLLKLAMDAGLEDRLRVVEPPVFEGKRAIALRPDAVALQQRLNAVIGPYLASPEYRALYAKWWGKPRPFWDTQRVAILMGVLLLAVTGVLVGWRVAGMATLNRRLQREVAEREEANRHLQEAIDVAEEMSAAARRADQAKSDFLANMSHELRTPLNGVLGMLQLLEATNPSAEQSTFIAPALTSGWNLLELVDDILDLTRIESDQLELRREPVVLARLTQAVSELFVAEAQQKGLALTTAVAADLPTAILGDEKRLRQILFNLVGNALKFTPAGSVELRFTATTGLSAGGRGLRIVVRDTGIGIAPEQLEGICEPFVQGEINYRKRFQGAGLGLAIVKRLIAAMGGALQVVSTPGHGTTVTVELPVEVPTQETLPLLAPRTEAAGQRRLRILLVEDNEANLQLLTLMIARRQHQVTAARNGQEALDCLAAADFDLVLMDIQMPVMDGLTALRHIRAGSHGVRDPAVPVVALTAYAMHGDQETFLAAGMNDYLSKPVYAARLDALLARHAGSCPA